MVAVDANGADRGPGAVAEGVRRSGLPVLLFGPASELSGAGPLAEVVDAPAAKRAKIEARTAEVLGPYSEAELDAAVRVMRSLVEILDSLGR